MSNTETLQLVKTADSQRLLQFIHNKSVELGAVTTGSEVVQDVKRKLKAGCAGGDWNTVWDLFTQGLNIHNGSLSPVETNNPDQNVDVLEALLSSLTATLPVVDIKKNPLAFQLLSALSYVDSVDFMGFVPLITTNVVSGAIGCENYEAVYYVRVQDEDVCPANTVAMSLYINPDLEMLVKVHDLSFLQPRTRTDLDMINLPATNDIAKVKMPKRVAKQKKVKNSNNRKV